jgi:hypothetical protein
VGTGLVRRVRPAGGQQPARPTPGEFAVAQWPGGAGALPQINLDPLSEFDWIDDDNEVVPLIVFNRIAEAVGIELQRHYAGTGGETTLRTSVSRAPDSGGNGDTQIRRPPRRRHADEVCALARRVSASRC